MGQTREELRMPPEEVVADRSLPVTVNQPRRPAPDSDPESRAAHDHDTGIQRLVFAFAAFNALVAGSASPAAGLGVFAVGLLGTLLVDRVVARRHREQMAAAR